MESCSTCNSEIYYIILIEQGLLFWFNLVLSVFAFSHIFVSIQVAKFIIIYVFTATSVLMNGWWRGRLYRLEGKTWENVGKCPLPALNACWCLLKLKYLTRWHSVKLLSGVIIHNESQLQSGFYSCKHASYICFPISTTNTRPCWRNGCLTVFGVVECTPYIIRR